MPYNTVLPFCNITGLPLSNGFKYSQTTTQPKSWPVDMNSVAIAIAIAIAKQAKPV